MSLRINVSKAKSAIMGMVADLERSAADILSQEMPAVLEAVRNVTPPASEGVNLRQGIYRGRSLVAADVYKVVKGVHRGGAVDVEDIGAVMRQYRRNGRVPLRLRPRLKADKAKIRGHIAEKQAKVGTLARNWRGRVIAERDGARLHLVNNTSYAANVQGLKQRVQKTLLKEKQRIKDKIMNQMLSAAARHGFKVR